MQRVLIIEDDERAAATLEGYLERYGDDHAEKFQVTHDTAAEGHVGDSDRYDLVFLDIDLPGIDGMQAARLLRAVDASTPLVFVTNLAQYAVRGYEVDALDFMVKPVSYRDFCLRMDKAMRRINRRTEKCAVIKTHCGITVVPMSELAFVEVRNHNLAYHLAGAEPAVLEVRGSLQSAEEALAGPQMIRASNKCLVNIDFVQTIQGSDLIMTTGCTIHLSRMRKREALDAIAEYLGSSR